MNKRLAKNDFEDIFDSPLSDYVIDKINQYNFLYQEISDQENTDALKKIIDALLNPDLPKSGEHRLEIWEKGWGENLDKFSKDLTVDAISPLYFEKFPVVRFKQRFIKPISKRFEEHSLAIIQDWLFDKYLRKAHQIYEFGCGTGHNLFRARSVNPNAELWGLDWATSSQKIIEGIRNEGIDKNIYASRFNYFEPDNNFKIKPNSIIYTVASLEQIGNKHNLFINYLIENKPDLCIHIEPIAELLDSNNILDFLSIKYFEKRNYLNGFLSHLKELEKEGKLEIIDAKRSYIGSLFIDGYSIIVWKPKK